MALTNALNPQAPEYIPLNQYLISFSPLPPTASPFLSASPAPPPPHMPFPYPCQLPSRVSNYTITNLSYQLQGNSSSNFLPLPASQPLPPVDVVPTSTAVAKSEQVAELIPRVNIRRKHVTSRAPQREKGGKDGSWACGEGRGKFGRGSSSGTVRERNKEGYIRERRLDNENWSNLKKHEMMPLRLEEKKTTVMVKNIPYEFTMLIDFMDKHCMVENQKVKKGSSEDAEKTNLSAYDFLYLPIDFKTKKNKGYAFVNFTKPRAVWKFFHAFHETRWNADDSSKVRRIIRARIQGREALVQHFEKSYFECESDEFLPVCFTPARDGSGDLVELTTVGKRKGASHHKEAQ